MKNILIVLALLVVGGGYYWYTQTSSTPVPATAQEKTVQADTAAVVGATKEISVSMSEFAYEPKTITVNKGDTVRVNFKNAGAYPHNFVITELNVMGKTVKPGESDVVTFVADKPGTYEFYCSVGNHQEKGMTGTLTVQ